VAKNVAKRYEIHIVEPVNTGLEVEGRIEQTTISEDGRV
jgi:hypothetical protein